MPVHRRNQRGPSNSVFNHRMGGRVSLFNFNPSIAGGKTETAIATAARPRLTRGCGSRWLTSLLCCCVGRCLCLIFQEKSA
jgi:hypothetical protein